MRILVVTQYFWPENFRINDLVAECCERGHEVTVLTGHPNYPSGEVFPEFQRNPSAYTTFGAATIVRVPMASRGRGGLRLMLNYASFAVSAMALGAWRLRGRIFDVIFVFEPSPITVGLPAVFLRYLKRAPLAFWVLDLWPETLEAVGVVSSKRALKAVGHVVSFIYNRCDMVLAQSRSFIPQIRRYCKAEKVVEYFPSWSDAEFDTSVAGAAKEIPASEGVFSIMFTGNIGDAQDFPSVLDAAERLKEDKSIRWLIVGDGRAFDWVKSEVRQRGLEHCVLMLGRYPIDRMPSFYRRADALLVSLKDEPVFAMTIPGKLQSYLAAGIPVLAMLNGEGAEIVARSGAGLSCPAGDGKALSVAARQLACMDSDRRQAMGARGLAIYKEEFDRAVLISRLLSWFEDLSAGSAGKLRRRERSR